MANLEINTILATTKKTKPDEANLGFGKYFTDHMFTMDYSDELGWHDPKITPYEPLQIEPAAMVFHYGQSVFEGLKAYKSSEGKVLLFRPWDNFKRLNISDERMCIPYLDEEFALKALVELIKVDVDWIPASSGTSLYIRPFMIATEPSVKVMAAKNYKFLIILSPVGPYYPSGLAPIDILVEDEYVRAVRGGIGAAKASANYAASLKSQQKAIQKGYAQVMWLDGLERKYIDEVGAMNVFFVINDELITPELNGSILAGITRDSVIKMAKSWGVKVTERKLSIAEVFAAAKDGSLKEAFGCGTAAVISPIKCLIMGDDKVQIADGNTGQLSNKLYDNLTGIQFGRVEDTFGWTKEVM
ncbi:MAG: branched-chain amino acid aminotransferase [Defluviitaleaceae bacterium]|nr:branched-chain amino acid aminotransferase [Defluviitaleaceae bacterium]